MKKITIYRGGLLQPFVLHNGDTYDSFLEIEDEKGKILASIPYINTDHTEKYQGGILAPGVYAGIVGARNNGDKAVWLYLQNRDSAKVKSISTLALEDTLLPSLVPNPNRGRRKEMGWILIHRGGLTWDYSHGCLTILDQYFDEFQKHLKIGEKFQVELVSTVISENLPVFQRIAKVLKILGGKR